MKNKFWHRLCSMAKRNQNYKNMTEKNINNEELQQNTGAPVCEESVENCNAGKAEQTEKDSNTEQENNCAEQGNNCGKQDSGKEETTAEGREEGTEETEISPLDKALAEIEELKTQMLYKQAEFDNFRKRTIKEKADLILNGGEKTVKAILPVLDDFERAIAQAEKTDDIEAIKEGMVLIYKKFVKTLETQGVQKIDTENKDFNTDYHEAVALVPGMGDDKKGKVIDCVQTGYTLNDKVIRHAKVAVGQ